MAKSICDGYEKADGQKVLVHYQTTFSSRIDPATTYGISSAPVRGRSIDFVFTEAIQGPTVCSRTVLIFSTEAAGDNLKRQPGSHQSLVETSITEYLGLCSERTSNPQCGEPGEYVHSLEALHNTKRYSKFYEALAEVFDLKYILDKEEIVFSFTLPSSAKTKIEMSYHLAYLSDILVILCATRNMAMYELSISSLTHEMNFLNFKYTKNERLMFKATRKITGGCISQIQAEITNSENEVICTVSQNVYLRKIKAQGSKL